MRAWKCVAMMVSVFGLLVGCQSGHKRVEKPVRCQEFALPPSDDPRWIEPTVGPQKRVPLAPYKSPSAIGQGPGPNGMPGGGGGPGMNPNGGGR